MAVPQHVARVSKTYAPYGYSIMEDVATSLGGSLTETGGNFYVGLFDDADVIVESASISWISNNSTAANHGYIGLDYSDNDGLNSNSVQLVPNASRTATWNATTAAATVPEKFHSLALTQPALGPKGKMRYVRVQDAGGAAWVASRPVFRARIRRKA